MVNVEAEELAVDLEAVTEPSRRSDLERLKNECFKRDDYRCVLIGTVDRYQRNRYPGEKCVFTSCAHIIPLSLGEQESIAAMVWTAVARYFPDMHPRNKD